MAVEVHNETGTNLPETRFLQLANYVLESLHVHPDTDVSVLFVDEEAMSTLHEQWMGEPGPTDVLSFPMDELRPGRPDSLTPAGILGDIVVCPTVAQQQAHAAGHHVDTELLILLTHGLLHLLGFDHAEPVEEHEMFTLQQRLVEGFIGAEGTRP